MKILTLFAAATLGWMGLGCRQASSSAGPNPAPDTMDRSAQEEQAVKEKIVKTPDQWRCDLTEMQYRVTRESATEPAFTGEYWNTKTPGVYACVACGEPLFTSKTKFSSGSGWPSFYEPVDKQRVRERDDTSHGMVRTEIVCSRCDAHLGHVFPDGPQPTGMRYCVNSASLKLIEGDPDKLLKEDQAGQ